MNTEDDNSIRHPFFILCICILFFSLISFFKIDVSALSEVDFLSEVKKIPEEIKPTPAHDTIAKHVETMLQYHVPDTLSERYEALLTFFKALDEEKDTSKKVRIAWFGDSMVEGDLITNDLRKQLQKRFGGNGVGFVPICSIVAGFRTSIIHSFSDTWASYNFVEKPPQGYHVGPMGYVHVAKGDCFVKYTACREYSAFKTAHLFYSNPDDVKLDVQVDNDVKTISLDGDEAVNDVVLTDSVEFNKIKISLPKSSTAFYGVSFENGDGVYVDNYSFRGCSGIPLSMIPDENFKSFSKKLNYKLIVLHYGLNIVSHNQKNYDWYTRSFKKVVRNIKEQNPDASIMLVSVGDKGYRKNGTWITEPNIPAFVKIQETLAKEEGVGFWNLYEAMGGENTMVKWVQEKPSKANSDYEHPNFRGAKEIADLFYKYLVTGYENYSKKKNEKESPVAAK